ncbi:RfbA dTDP-glucose pyrophosphorylase [uncultured Caudovirales phage]|uniref:glucose-1-phosphate thymidylyltransferase n=1 Tax=uncultured Caudovirales phage TaxID=2100421 RepID=A0A6J5KTI2_9CAUD|nr:RfbA dTDP-glucose pyrophosphorylase [uncultured Caudovirales phage]
MSKKTLGIILAAGKSSRLYPATLAATKQVLPIYDKPLVYYPLSTLMLAGVREFVLISTPQEKPIFQALFKDCEETMGIKMYYGVQNNSNGIADAFNVVMETLHGSINVYDRYALILGDNIFYGATMSGQIRDANEHTGATIFATKVSDPERFGIVELNGKVAVSLEEKPETPKSNLAVTGLYFYPQDVFDRVYRLKPSLRGELEITDLNREYLNSNDLTVIKLARGVVWFDTGTPDSMLDASNIIQTLQKRQNILIGSPHEVAYNNGWINQEQLFRTITVCNKTEYGSLLANLLSNE